MFRRVARKVAPPPNLKTSEWADQNRYLPDTSPEPGRWRTSRVPYMREPMDCLGDPDVEELILMFSTQVGKALALDTPIPTPSGWTTMGDLGVGDELFGPDGRKCRVTFATGVQLNRECFEVKFSDGTSVVADADHLWRVEVCRWPNRGKVEVRTTASMIADLYKNGAANYAIPLTAPLELPHADLPVDPYLAGLWLGDGDSKGAFFTVSASDREMYQGLSDLGLVMRELSDSTHRVKRIVLDYAGTLENKEKFCSRGHPRDRNGTVNKKGHKICRECNRQHSLRWKYTGSPLDPVTRPESLHATLKRVFSGKKEIPAEYLRGSRAQRLALLQGLMDTDGSCSRQGHPEFTTTSPRLAEGMLELLRSLGMKPTIRARETSIVYKGARKSCATAFRITFLCYSDFPLFRLKRKQERLPKAGTGRPTKTKRRFIRGIVPSKSVPVRCIQVDSPDRMFLAGRAMVPTHNTELLLNGIGKTIDLDPCSMLLVEPDLVLAETMSKNRIAAMLKDCPALRGKVKEPRQRDSGNTLLEKMFPGGYLAITGSNSPASLANRPIRRLYMDEIDRYRPTAEGDPQSLAEKRTANFTDTRQIVRVSSPSKREEDATSITAHYKRSDQRKYFLPCPFCGHEQILKLEHFVYKSTPRPDGKERVVADSVALECGRCRKSIDESKKDEMLARGRWIAEGPKGRVRGYWLNEFYSPWRRWHAVIQDYLDKKDDPQTLRTFYNTSLAELVKGQGEAPEWQKLYDAREKYKEHTVPYGALFLTAGVDVQKDRIECEVIGWGRGFESWSVAYFVLDGDTSTKESDAWVKLSEVLNSEFAHESGVFLPIRMMAVDSQYRTQVVYNWVRQWPRSRVVAVKGKQTLPAPAAPPRASDLKKNGKPIRRGMRYWPVGTNHIKEELYDWLKLERPEDPDQRKPGLCHFPEYEEEHFKQLTAEQGFLKTIKGVACWVYEKVYNRNERLDCRVYGRAAASIFGMDRWTSRDWEALEAQIPARAIRTQGETSSPRPEDQPTEERDTRGRGERWLP
jgi:phage terminase large subunit GpA-like protein